MCGFECTCFASLLFFFRWLCIALCKHFKMNCLGHLFCTVERCGFVVLALVLRVIASLVSVGTLTLTHVGSNHCL